MTKETLPIVILIATLVLLLVAFSVFLWEPIYELRKSLSAIESLEDLSARVKYIEDYILRDEAKKEIVREMLNTP